MKEKEELLERLGADRCFYCGRFVLCFATLLGNSGESRISCWDCFTGKRRMCSKLDKPHKKS